MLDVETDARHLQHSLKSVGRQTVKREDGVRDHLLPFRNLGNFVYTTLPVSFGRDTKNVDPFSLVPGEVRDSTQE